MHRPHKYSFLSFLYALNTEIVSTQSTKAPTAYTFNSLAFSEALNEYSCELQWYRTSEDTQKMPQSRGTAVSNQQGIVTESSEQDKVYLHCIRIV